MPSTVNIADLGRRVRAMRLARKMTLEDVVAKTEFTVSWLSKLENGLLSPSLEGLVRLAEVLQGRVETLVEGLVAPPPRFALVRNGNGHVRKRRGGKSKPVTESLADGWHGRTMHPVILHLAGQGPRNRVESHDGERLLHVLEGAVEVAYGGEQFRLTAGDSLYLQAAVPHSVAPAAGTTAKVLSVSSGSDGQVVSAKPARAVTSRQRLATASR